MPDGKIVDFKRFNHARTTSEARRSTGTCISPKASQVTPGIPLSLAAAMTRSQYSTGIEALRRCSPAVEGPFRITRAYAALPPKTSISSATVVGPAAGEAKGESLAIVSERYRNSVDSVNRTSVDIACDDPSMGDINDRLRLARRRAGFASAAAAARKLGMKSSTYASHENGQTPPPPKAVRRYAKVFKASAAWILTGEGTAEARNLVPLVGRIGAGGDIDPEFEQVPEGGFEDLDLAINIGVEAIAFEVTGASMRPRYDPGVIVVCSREGRDPEAFIGSEVAVRTADNKRFLKTLRPGRRRGLYTLESFNADPIEDVRLAWVGEILAIIPHRRRSHTQAQRRRAS